MFPKRASKKMSRTSRLCIPSELLSREVKTRTTSRKSVIKMGGFLNIVESDHGSKGRARTATIELPKEISKESKWRLRSWWEMVKETAKSLCPFETGTLRMTIRIEPQGVTVSGGPSFMVVASPEHELINSQIVAGGILINPKTGRICDYAMAVHDGTLRMMARPFMTDAINIHIDELYKILGDAIQQSVNTVWVGY